MYFCLFFFFYMKNPLLKFIRAFIHITCIKYGTPVVRTHVHSSFRKEKIVESLIFAKNFFKMNCTRIMKYMTFIPHIFN